MHKTFVQSEDVKQTRQQKNQMKILSLTRKSAIALIAVFFSTFSHGEPIENIKNKHYNRVTVSAENGKTIQKNEKVVVEIGFSIKNIDENMCIIESKKITREYQENIYLGNQKIINTIPVTEAKKKIINCSEIPTSNLDQKNIDKILNQD